MSPKGPLLEYWSPNGPKRQPWPWAAPGPTDPRDPRGPIWRPITPYSGRPPRLLLTFYLVLPTEKDVS